MIDKVDKRYGQKLTPEVLAPYLERGESITSIARHLGLSKQAVSKYIQRHKDQLPLVDIDRQIASICGTGALRAYQYLTDDKLRTASAKQIADIIDTLYSTALKAQGRSPSTVSVYIQAIQPFLIPRD